MFAAAYRQASAFTKPVIISRVRADGQCFAGIGSFVVVNEDGWIVTAAHIMDQYEKLAAEKRQHAENAIAIAAINSDAGLLSEQKRKKTRELQKQLNAKTAVDFSFWWGGVGTDAAVVKEAYGVPAADLAIARLEPFDLKQVPSYPLFKNPEKEISQGTSLCRLGFPFHEIKPTYAEGRFALPPETFPMVFFPNEGILTRVLIVNQQTDIYSAFIETSNPGLMGQSGGPIFDRHGTVWGIQSNTAHLPLGFSPTVPGKPDQKEHQFLNVGRGVHPATIVALFRQRNVRHNLSDY